MGAVVNAINRLPIFARFAVLFGLFATPLLLLSYFHFGQPAVSAGLQAITVAALTLCAGVLVVIIAARSIVAPWSEAKEKLFGISRAWGWIEYKLDGTILGCNAKCEAIVGYRQGDIVGKHHSIFVEAEYAKSTEYRQFWERLARGEQISQKYKRKNGAGQDVWMQANYIPVLDASGRPKTIINYLNDVTALEHEQEVVVQELAAGLKKLAEGKLTVRIDNKFAEKYDELRVDFNSALTRLQDTMKAVLDGAFAISTGAGEISQAADDLARRTEQQAASLEETAAALEEITATVKKTALNTKESKASATTAKEAAEEGGRVVETAIKAMDSIAQSSKQITDIIGVIDEIAFQTNLLALNAGVEAARAGDAGKGFAVVASEVRALAQRSSEAAKQIKTLIKTSGEHVGAGVKFVGESGEALKRIVDQVVQINGLVTEMAQAAEQQSTGIEQVNVAVGQMDQVTQQNAAMVEQSTAASRNLAQETKALSDLVGFFSVGETKQVARPDHVRPTSQPAASPQVRPGQTTHRPANAPGGHRSAVAVARKPAAAGEAAEDWTEF